MVQLTYSLSQYKNPDHYHCKSSREKSVAHIEQDLDLFFVLFMRANSVPSFNKRPDTELQQSWLNHDLLAVVSGLITRGCFGGAYWPPSYAFAPLTVLKEAIKSSMLSC